MHKNLQNKILASVLALGAFSYSLPSNALADDYYVQQDNEIVVVNIPNESVYGNGHSFTVQDSNTLRVYGNKSENDANGSNVTVNGSTIDHAIIGGHSSNANSTNNKLTINNSTTNVIYGGYISTDGNGKISGNIVTIKDSIIFVKACGGYTNGTSEVNNNTITVSGNSDIADIRGGDSIEGNIYNNHVIIKGNTTADNVSGASSSTGEAVDNTVTIIDAAIINFVKGGYSIHGDVIGNSVIITSSRITGKGEAYIYGNFDGDVYGGESNEGNATNNNVRITNREISGNVYGGSSSLSPSAFNPGEVAQSDGNADYNIVNISGSKIGGNIYGGSSSVDPDDLLPNQIIHSTGHANYNTISISNHSELAGNVYGGFSDNGTASYNTVEINDSEIRGNFLRKVYGGYSESGATDYNKIDITDSTIAGSVAGGTSKNNTSTYNTVNITNSTISNGACGGISDKGDAEYNIVNISGNSTTNNSVYGGRTNVGNANDNIVNISGGTITGDIYGGDSLFGNANNNVINISSGTINGMIYGGYAAGGIAVNNKINVSGSTNIENADIFGGIGSNTLNTMNLSKNNNTTTGNTLTLDGWSGKVNSINNFETLNFNNIEWDTDNPVLTVKNENGATSDLSNTSIGTVSFAGGSYIKAGESMTLIANSDNFSAADTTTDFIAGAALEGTASAEKDGNNLVYTVKSVKTSGQTALVTQSRAVSAAFINQGTDLISDSLDTLSRDGNYGVKTFAAVHGSRSKYDVNSDLKINGWSTIVGVGNAAEFADGDEFSWGVFYENGSGNYRTFNEFNNEFFRGDGSLVYNGGGIAARYKNASGVYTEGSLRAGILKNEMDNVLQDTNHVGHGYKTESAYYGAHIGVGKIISLSDNSDLDVYGKFFHTYTDSDSFTVAKDKFELDSITSDRLRLGARITTNKANAFSTYYGLAYEYEFNGDADMRAQGVTAPQESLQGSSYMAEVGFNYQPTPDSPWSFDMNLRGYAGEREGASFNVQATYTF